MIFQKNGAILNLDFILIPEYCFKKQKASSRKEALNNCSSDTNTRTKSSKKYYISFLIATLLSKKSGGFYRMKWFKHYSNSHRDQTLKGIFRKYGLEGEARFWRLIELMAERFENDEVQFVFDLETIRESLRFRSATDCRPFLDHLTTLSRMKVEYSGNSCLIIYDKILEIKDNHTKNLQVTGKSKASKLPLEEKRIRIRKRIDNNIVNADVDFTHPLEIESEKVNKNPYQQKANGLAEMWNDMAELNNLPKVKIPVSNDRVKTMTPAMKEFDNIDDWYKIICTVTDNPFNLGENDRKWKANFDWLFHKTKFNYRKLWEARNESSF